jgi:Fe-S-cluster-containing hydrogenase component 2
MPISVVYRSRGSLLLCGSADRVSAALPLLPTGLKTLAVIAGDCAVEPSRSLEAVPGTLVQLRGHLGCFRASVAGPRGAMDLAPMSPNGDGLFDLVLDLYERPLIESEVPPLGYARTRGSTAELEAKLQRLAEQVGTINKPRYYSYDQRLCAHDRQGVPGCRTCLDACPADAIHADTDGIAIDPYLCRGCGTCALVCPTGAVRYARPKPRVTLQAIAEALAPSLCAGQDQPREAPLLVIHAGDPGSLALPHGIPHGIPRLAVPSLGSVGIELWFAALALGASRVLLLRSGLLTPTGTCLIEQQVDLARKLLRALGEAPERIRFVSDPQQLDWGGLSNPWPATDVGRLARADAKRDLLLTAFSHLEGRLPSGAEPVALDRGSPFGAIAIDSQRCTLCYACVGMCPTGALHNRAGALTFTESDCVQCSLCVNACPERALSLEPRAHAEALASRHERTLKTASEAFPCVVCGAPVGTRSWVEGSMAHVRDHPMFQGEGLRLLQMCQGCRQKAALGLSGVKVSAFSSTQEEKLR